MIVRYVHAPARNISIARNAVLQASRDAGARYLAFLDDDELADPSWLVKLLERQAETGAEAVVGPVRALYRQDAPRWMQAGSVHDMRQDPGPDGTLRQGHTSNVLIDLAAPALLGLRFDPARGRTGGEDTAFFCEMIAGGGRIVWAPDAMVEETVPGDRTTLRWLLRRRYRMGQTHASLIGNGMNTPARAAALALACAKAFACFGMAGVRSFNELSRNRALMRGALHIGAVAELVGLDRIEPYGDGPRMQQKRPPEGAGR
jgi:succinoglycan biosynthesis protein ExoM